MQEVEKARLLQELTGAAYIAPLQYLQDALKVLRGRGAKRTLITARQAAAILEACPETCKRYARQGLLTPFKIGPRKLRFDKSEVEALANGEGVQDASA